MRFIVALLSLTSLLALNVAGAETSTLTPDALVQRGIESYRAGKIADAATDLEAAAQAFLSQEQMQNYVDTGKFPNLDRFETALVYLTLAQSKLGHQDQAREAVLRIVTAERIQPTYAQLSLPAEVASFESIAARLVPNATLPANTQLAQGGTAPTPAVTAATTSTTTTSTTTVTPSQTAQATATTPAPVTQAAVVPAPVTQAAMTTPSAQVTSSPPKPVPAPKPATPPVQVAQTTTATTQERVPVQPTTAAERADRQRIIDELVAQERAKIQQAADERIAQIQRDADARVAQAQREAEEQLAALQAQNRSNYLLSLRQADAMAANGKVEQANDIYNAIVNSPDVAREIVAEAAVGLYRTGAFRGAANAFAKLVPYKHGEEDLRYYNAVSLYETGQYNDAKRELACALPYLEVTADVTRYRERIEQMSSQASR